MQPIIQGAPARDSVSLLTSGTAAAVATLDIVLTGYTGFRLLLVELINYVPVTDNTTIILRTSTNGGSSYDAGASDYWWVRNRQRGGAQFSDSNGATTGIEMVVEVATDTSRSANVRFWLRKQAVTTYFPKIRWEAEHHDAADDQCLISGHGRRLTAGDVDAFRVLSSSGNISTVDYAVYGYA